MKIKLEKTPSFWMYIVGGFMGIVLGILLLPAWAGVDVFFSSWSAFSVNIMIGGLLLAYILLYLVKRIRRYSNTPAQTVAVVELVLMAVLAVVCAVSEFVDHGITFGGPCQIFGIALWVRGASGVYTGYYCDSNVVKAAEQEKKAKKKNGGTLEEVKEEKKEKDKPKALDTNEVQRGKVDDFTVWRLTLAIILITAGTYLFVKPAFEKIHLQWVFSCAIIGVACFLVVLGFILKPQKIKVETQSPVKKPEDSAKNTQKESKENKSEPTAEAAGYLESGKVKINLDSSANAMTQTAAYDAIKEEAEVKAAEDEKENKPEPKKDKADSKKEKADSKKEKKSEKK